MTNEEIEKQARTLLEMLGQEPHPDAVTDTVEAMRALVSQAYEEAAGVFERRCYAERGKRPCGDCISCADAQRIRALKPSPESVPVESAST